MPSLLTPIQSLPGIGPVLARKFASLGLVTLEDALWHFPIRHEDWRTQLAIKDIRAGVDATIHGELVAIHTKRSFRRRGMSVTHARLDDGTAVLPIIWFNQPYLQQSLQPGERLFVSGRVEQHGEILQLTNPAWERPSADPTHQKLIPIYATVEGLSQRTIRTVMKHAIELVNLIPDHLPPEIASKYDLRPKHEALVQIHFPESPTVASAAVRRLQFDELLRWQLRWLSETEQYQSAAAPVFPFNEFAIRSFVQSLPFELTTDQRQVAWEILQDIGQSTPMSRLLQGDVGAGKTVVAAIAARGVTHQGGQVAVLAPTIVLAQQHFETFTRFFHDTETTIALLTGDQVAVNTSAGPLTRRTIETAIQDGNMHIVIGTHAVLDEEIRWKNLGLVMVDEQQRFGVSQRAGLLTATKKNGQATPHFLSLTATPIPRTFALFLAGELAISRLHQKPAGRQPIATELVVGPAVAQLNAVIDETTRAGHQVFYITPLIEESDHFGAHAATVEHTRLRESHPRLRVGLLHGAMPATDRLAIMDEFRKHELDVLVSTTVIEVGLDIPDATLIIIDGADRFGLSQLHQLRGRVGRREQPGRCILVTERIDEKTMHRLTAVTNIDDGLELAELDLQERGSGELYGLRQSGLPDWHLASLHDEELLTAARETAKELKARHQEGALLLDEEWKTPLAVQHRE